MVNSISSSECADEIKPASNTFLSLLWGIYGNNFYEKKLIENTEIGNLKGKIEEFVPKLMRLKLD